MSRVAAVRCVLAVVVGCVPPVLVKPQAPVASDDPQFDAALGRTVGEFAKGVEYREAQMGAVYPVSTGWHVEQRRGGVTYGRSKQVDALFRAASGCYVVHFVVVQAFDGRDYQDSYTANRSSAFAQGPSTPREDIACADFH